MYTWIQTTTHCLLRELSGPRPLCRGTDFVSKLAVCDLKIYIVYKLELVYCPKRDLGRVVVGVKPSSCAPFSLALFPLTNRWLSDCPPYQS